MSWGRITDLVLAHLKEAGPRMRFQIEQELGLPTRSLGDVITRLTRVSKSGPSKGRRRAHICGWTRGAQGVGRDIMARPIYAAGNGADAPKPPPLPWSETGRRYRARKKGD